MKKFRGFHIVGLKEEGTVVAESNNMFGQLNVSGFIGHET